MFTSLLLLSSFLNMFTSFSLKSHVWNVINACKLCYKLLCPKITLIFYCWFYFPLVCLHPFIEKSVLLALETRLGGNFVGSGENFLRLFADKSFLLNDVWLQIYYICFRSWKYNSTLVQAHATRKSNGHCIALQSLQHGSISFWKLELRFIWLKMGNKKST